MKGLGAAQLPLGMAAALTNQKLAGVLTSTNAALGDPQLGMSHDEPPGRSANTFSSFRRVMMTSAPAQYSAWLVYGNWRRTMKFKPYAMVGFPGPTITLVPLTATLIRSIPPGGALNIATLTGPFSPGASL